MYLRYRDPTWESAEPTDRSPSVPDRVAAAPPTAPPAPTSGLAPAPAVHLLGVQLHQVTESDCVARILAGLDAGRGGAVVTPNLDHLRRCVANPAFRTLVAEADLVVADGMPLVWASRLQGTPLPQRVAGSNLISSLSAAAAERGRSIFLLGGNAGTAEAAADVLTSRHPGLRIAGTFFPRLGFEQDSAQTAALAAHLADCRPDIVFVALGSPKQEQLIARLRTALPAAWWLGVGISFSFLCGDVRRAPAWMQATGTEWLHRLAQEPRRLFKRYLVQGLPFAVSLLARSALRGAAARVSRKTTMADTLPETIDVPAAPTAMPSAPPAKPDIPPRLELQVFVQSARPTADTDIARRLRALVLLGGSVRPTPLGAATGRSVLDLPLDARESILGGWRREAEHLRAALRLGALPVRLMLNHGAAHPTSCHAGACSITVERDLSEYRGTGGVLRDIADDYADDDLILVANAAQVLLDPLAGVVDALHRCGGDVSVVSHQDGTPTGVMLIACRTLRAIPESGFVDMKEQALPRIAADFDVRVLNRRRPSGLPLRTLEDYVVALRYHHVRRNTASVGTTPAAAADPLAENFLPAFSVVEPGARVDASARLHDSVVLAGGVVEPGAVLVRSLVCAGGVVKRDKTAIGQFVTAATGQRRRRGQAVREGRAA